MMSLAGGIIALVVGIVLLIFWWGSFLVVLMGCIPILLILGGALATYLGIEEIKDKTSSEDFDDDSSGLKNEVENLKEEIKELKEEKAPPEGDEAEKKE
jgi:hypothetical protein